MNIYGKIIGKKVDYMLMIVSKNSSCDADDANTSIILWVVQ